MGRGQASRSETPPPARARTHRGRIVAGLATIAALAGLAVLASRAPRPALVKRDPGLSVLVVSVDTLRADALGCYGRRDAQTPWIDRLAAEGVRFETARAHNVVTLPSHANLLSGQYPLRHGVRDNTGFRFPAERATLATILRERGWQTGAFVSAFPLDSRFGLDRGFDVYDDRLGGTETAGAFAMPERAGTETVRAALRWIDSVRGQRWFAFVHLYEPHFPYEPPAPLASSFPAEPYQGEVAAADAALGPLLEPLLAAGGGGRALVVFTSDHGESLGEHGETTHGIFAYEATLRVPLVLRAPGLLPARVVRTPVRHVDVVPTILDLLGMAVPDGVRGTSLLPYVRGRKTSDLPSYIETVYPRENYGWSELRGVIDGPWKYIQAPKPELYDLAQDPREERNLVSDQPAVVKDKTRKLDALIAGSRALKGAKRRTLSAAETERLRSLGYLGGGAAGGAADPKDKIEDYLLTFRANLLENEGRLDQAAECYRQVLAANPDVPSNHVNLALLEMRMGRPDEAIRTLERAMVKFPDSELVLSRLMGLYLNASRWQDALSVGRALLANDPSHFDALFLSGNAYARLGRWEDAAAGYRKALAIEPENAELRRRHADALRAAAVSFRKNGNLKDAILWMKRYLEAAPLDDKRGRVEGRRLLEEWERASKSL